MTPEEKEFQLELDQLARALGGRGAFHLASVNGEITVEKRAIVRELISKYPGSIQQLMERSKIWEPTICPEL